MAELYLVRLDEACWGPGFRSALGKIASTPRIQSMIWTTVMSDEREGKDGRDMSRVRCQRSG
jgi:hypothetical protein